MNRRTALAAVLLAVAAVQDGARASCDGHHYFVKVGGVWTCTICGETR